MNAKKTNTVTCEQCKHSRETCDRKGNESWKTLWCGSDDLPPGMKRTNHGKNFSCGYGKMAISNSQQKKTLERIFAMPTPNDILWTEIESFLNHTRCIVENRKGSRVLIQKDSNMIIIHRPHPGNQTPPDRIRSIKKFLAMKGITP
jgi:hypothetical protein